MLIFFYNLIWKCATVDQFSKHMKESSSLYQAKIAIIFSKLLSFNVQLLIMTSHFLENVPINFCPKPLKILRDLFWPFLEFRRNHVFKKCLLKIALFLFLELS